MLTQKNHRRDNCLRGVYIGKYITGFLLVAFYLEQFIVSSKKQELYSINADFKTARCDYQKQPFTEDCARLDNKSSVLCYEFIITLCEFLLAGAAIGATIGFFATRPASEPPLEGNRKTINKFYEANPNYSCPDGIEVQKIWCSILQDNSKAPVCISFSYKENQYKKVYDYSSLMKHFMSSKNDPLTGIDLSSSEVTHLSISFKIPENVLEANPPQISVGNRF